MDVCQMLAPYTKRLVVAYNAPSVCEREREGEREGERGRERERERERERLTM
jgi:hypothetical protein